MPYESASSQSARIEKRSNDRIVGACWKEDLPLLDGVDKLATYPFLGLRPGAAIPSDRDHR